MPALDRVISLINPDSEPPTIPMTVAGFERDISEFAASQSSVGSRYTWLSPHDDMGEPTRGAVTAGSIPAGSVLRGAGGDAFVLNDEVRWPGPAAVTIAPDWHTPPRYGYTTISLSSILSRYVGEPPRWTTSIPEGAEGDAFLEALRQLEHWRGADSGGRGFLIQNATPSRVFRNWVVETRHPAFPQILTNVAVLPEGFTGSGTGALAPVRTVTALVTAIGAAERVTLVAVAGAAGAGTKVRANLVDHSGGETVATGVDQEGEPFQRNLIIEQSSWFMRYRPDVSTRTILQDDRGALWDIVSLREVGRLSYMEIGCSRSFDAAARVRT